jgi:hypothetical protein
VGKEPETRHNVFACLSRTVMCTCSPGVAAAAAAADHFLILCGGIIGKVAFINVVEKL